ncbi:MAG: 4Fe-4S cluster-binding domain-containing protein [Deltaproteobacteria bacterium]|nr:4Fe-4S cluster-binding domain-containing protein [Deltaproteobacteria bacterium]
MDTALFSKSATSLTDNNNLIHDRFGNLGRLDAVLINQNGAHLQYAEFDPTSIHLTVTGRCYARCQGCINATITSPCHSSRAEFTPVADTNPKRDAAAIVNLLGEHPDKEGVICFYGGEPLLAPQAIMEVMAGIDAGFTARPVKYMLYTNGDLLEATGAGYPDLINRLWLVSVSIDGQRDQHERIRIGTSLDRIHKGLTSINPLCPGAVLMWSTLREEQSLADCFKEFMILYEQGVADQFFWHWVETGEPFADVAGYAARYERELSMIMDVYVDHLRQGIILPLVHVNELILFVLAGVSRNSSGCGVELAENYDLIDGKIHSCADLPPELAIGSIDEHGNIHFTPHDLLALVSYKDKLGCYHCGVHSYCGGRCPVQAHAGSPLRLTQYCQLMRLHVGIVLERLDEISALIKQHELTAQQIYDSSAIYAQFTDVTP